MARTGLRVGIAGVACALAATTATPVFAQVLELQADGSFVRSTAPMARLTIGLQPVRGETRYADQVFFAQGDLAVAIRESSKRYAVPASVLEAVAWQESRFNQRAISPRGARGVMQLMPGTARGLGVNAGDMKANIDGGANYLAQQLRRFGDLRLALAAYNAGPEAVDRYGDVPPYAETQSYVDAILASLEPAMVIAAERAAQVD